MKTSQFLHREFKNSLMIKCLAVSLLLHVAILAFLYHHPLILRGNFPSLFGLSAAAPEHLENEGLDGIEKNQLLEDVFQKIVVLSPHLQQPFDLAELPKGMALAPNRESTRFELPEQQEMIAAPLQETLLAAAIPIPEKEEHVFPPLFSPEEKQVSLLSQLQIDVPTRSAEISFSSLPLKVEEYTDAMPGSELELHAQFETDYALNLSSQLTSNSLKSGKELQIKLKGDFLSANVTARDLNLEHEILRPTLFIPKSLPSTEKRQASIAAPMPSLEQYDFPAIALAAEWNDDFDAEVTFLPNPEGQGYIFSVALKPNFDISAHSLKQNFYFILDRSDSVQRHRFSVFKRGVMKALSSMQYGDTFNIFVVDKKITRFSAENCAVTMKNIQAAEEFLDKQEGGNLFSASEIYGSLEKILASVPDNEEIHTAVLLTDGKSNLNAERRQTKVKKWVEKNNGKMALYTAAVGRDNDLIALDLLSSVSGGSLLYSDTHASFPRKLAKLIIDLKDPVAKDLVISTIPQRSDAQIEFYPANSHLPSLYSHRPYTLIGQIDDPCTFDLIIQGRHRDQWIAIKKNISFVEGQKGDRSLTMQWAAQRANLCYAKFLKEGKSVHLKEAKEILKKSRFEVAFE